MVKKLSLASLALVVALATGCGTGSGTSTTGASPSPTPIGANVEGAVAVDGSSTVTPIMEAVAEEFKAANPKSDPTVATSGTGGGFKKFANGEIDISMASRPIKPEEAEKCKAAGIDFVEIPVAMDGLTVVVNKENTWVDHLTVSELKKIWEPSSKINNWKDVRPGFPDVPLKLYGAGTDSGTFDYFTLAINGKEKDSRADYQASEDDNVLVQGVKGDKGALGYFGLGYYQENASDLKVVKIDAEKGAGPVEPSESTVNDASYQPLSRPLFIYVSLKAATENPAVAGIVDFLLDSGDLVKEAKYLPLPTDAIGAVKKHWAARKTGTLFHGSQVGLGIKEVLATEQGH